jgi:anti-anti-sigma factor
MLVQPSLLAFLAEWPRGAVTVPVHGQLIIPSDSKRTIESKLSRLRDIGCSSFVLDLENVSKMDSSGMADIVALYKVVADRGGHLDLINLPRQIRDILEITKMARVFDQPSDPKRRFE